MHSAKTEVRSASSGMMAGVKHDNESREAGRVGGGGTQVDTGVGWLAWGVGGVALKTQLEAHKHHGKVKRVSSLPHIHKN